MPYQPNRRSPWKANAVANATFVIGTEATNAITVAVQLVGQDGRDLAVRGWVNWFLSSDANGDAKAAAASGGVAIGTDGHLTALVAGLSGWAVSEADGDIDIVITEATAKSFYLVLLMPDGSLKVSSAITFA